MSGPTTRTRWSFGAAPPAPPAPPVAAPPAPPTSEPPTFEPPALALLEVLLLAVCFSAGLAGSGSEQASIVNAKKAREMGAVRASMPPDGARPAGRVGKK